MAPPSRNSPEESANESRRSPPYIRSSSNHLAPTWTCPSLGDSANAASSALLSLGGPRSRKQCGGTSQLVAIFLPSAGGMCTTGHPARGFLMLLAWFCLAGDIYHVIRGHLVPKLALVSLILHPRASGYLLYGKLFSTWEMRLKIMPWEVYVRSKRCIYYLSGRNQGQI